MESVQSDRRTADAELEALAPPDLPAEREVDLLDLLLVLAERKRLILKTAFACGIVAAIVVLLVPNRYTATATIMPPQQTQSAAATLMSQLLGGTNGLGSLVSLAGKDLGLKNPNDLYVGLLKSRTVKDSLISQFDLQRVYRDKKLSDARKDLDSYTDILSDKNGLIDISFEDKDPQRAAAVANAYVEQLRSLTQHLAVSEASQRRIFFEQQVEQAKSDLANAESAFVDMQQKTGLIQLDSQARAIIQAVGTLRAQIAAKEVELQAMRTFATAENPDLVRTQQELAGLRVQLADLERRQPSEAGEPLMTTSKVPGAALEYVRRYREVKYREQVFELLAKQYEAAKLDEAKEATVIQVVAPAIPPDKKSSPKRFLIVVIALLAGLLVGSVWAIAGESVSRMRQDERLNGKLSQLRSLVVFSRRDLSASPKR